MIHKTYKYRLYPNQLQRILLAKHFGCCRFVYNWGLAERKKYYEETGKTLGKFEQMKRLTQFKKENQTSFLKEVNSQSLTSSLANLDEAYKKFFSGSGFPKFKKKSGKQSATFHQKSEVDFATGKLFVMKFREGINCVFHRKFEGKIKSVTIKKTSTDKYFASILVEVPGDLPPKPPIEKLTTIGVDVGITHFATLSTGEKIDNPRFLKSSLKRLAVLSRRASRKKKGSNNQKKAYKKVAKLHEKITNQRNDFLHKLTTRLIRENQTISAETLNIEGMVKNRRLSQAISDVGWGEMFRRLQYKSEWYGRNFVQIGQFLPSSKTCSLCGHKNTDLELKDREWTCRNCLAIHDRDLNAAENIKSFGLNSGSGRPEELAESPALAGAWMQETLF